MGDHHVTWFKVDPSSSISSPLTVGTQLFTIDQRYSISFYSTSAKDSFWSLEIYQLNPSDEGTYICKIANRKASVSVYIHLHVQIPMTLHPTHICVEPNTTIKLTCSILISNEENVNDRNINKSVIGWHFSSSQLNKTKLPDVHTRIKLSNNTLSSYLIINQAQTYHTGKWTCIYKHQLISADIVIQKGKKDHN